MTNETAEGVVALILSLGRVLLVAAVLWVAAWLSDYHVKLVSCLLLSGMFSVVEFRKKEWMVRQLNTVCGLINTLPKK